MPPSNETGGIQLPVVVGEAVPLENGTLTPDDGSGGRPMLPPGATRLNVRIVEVDLVQFSPGF